MSSGEKFRTRSSVIAAWVMYFFLLGMVIETFATAGLLAGIVAVLICSLIGAGFYLALHRPYVFFTDESITIVNPLRRYEFKWLDIESIDVKYTMTITVGGRIISAWATPAAPRRRGIIIHPDEVKGLGIELGGSIAHGEHPQSDSGAATYIARQKWSAARQR